MENTAILSNNLRPSSGRVALVAGATGLVGRELVKSLLQQLASPSTWIAVYGIARRQNDVREENESSRSSRSRSYYFIQCDLVDNRDTLEKLGPLASSVTDLFWVTWSSQFPAGSVESCNQNRGMLSNVLDALLGPQCPAPALCHVALQTGTGHYISLPAPENHHSTLLYDEESPRVDSKLNFYYALEDILKERLHSVRWSVHRPGLILGSSARSCFNVMGCIGVYAALCKRLNFRFTFFGHPDCWEKPYMDASDARLVAEQHLWWASSNAKSGKSCGEAFNAVNESMFTWKKVWRVLATKFGFSTYQSSNVGTYTDLVGDKGEVWKNIVEEEGLQPTKMEDLANWAFLDVLFRFPSQILVSHGKAYRMGFESAHDCKDITACFLYWVDQMKDERLIP